MQALRSGIIYFLIVFAAGFVLGTIRTLWIAPSFGEVVAVAAELPVMVLLSWLVCGFVLRRWPVSPSTGARLLMGGTAFVLLLAAEALVSVLLGGITFGEHIALYGRLPAQLGLAGQIPFALFPLIRRS